MCLRADLKRDWMADDWYSIIPNLTAGRYDAIMAAMSVTGKRRALTDFTEPYFPAIPSVYLAWSGSDDGVVNGRVAAQTSIRLGKRPDKRTPFIRDFVRLADPGQLVFGAWDPIPDNAYEAAIKCGAPSRHEEIEPIGDFLRTVDPWRRCSTTARPGASRA